MVASFKRYRCEGCGKIFDNSRKAESCEIGHIADDAVKDFSKKLADILARKSAVHAPETGLENSRVTD